MRRSTLALYSLARCKLSDVGAADMICARFTTFTMISLSLPDWIVVFDTKTGVFVAAPVCLRDLPGLCGAGGQRMQALIARLKRWVVCTRHANGTVSSQVA